MSCLVYSGGYNHPFHESSPAVAEIAEARGLKTRIETDFAAALAGLADARIFVVNALHFTMTQHPKYEPDRARWAFELEDADLAAIVDFVGRGGSLLAIHTATICFDTQPGWRALLGGGWQWGRSHHPLLGPIHVELTEAGRVLCPGVDGFDVEDEAYHHLDPVPEARILATSAIAEGPQPIAWLKQAGPGRVGVDALGHDRRSLGHPAHQALLGAMFDWLGGTA